MQKCDTMKKVSEPFPGGKYDSSEVSRRLYRGAIDAARRLEEQIRTTSQQDLLGPEVTGLRMRLKDYCERLMFADPAEYGKKAEELMWRKVYYDIIQVYKQQKKKIHGSQPDYMLQNCLLVGIGNYHHLLLRLQAEFQLNIEGKVEIPFLWQQKGIKKERWKRHQRSLEVEEGKKEWALHTCHRFLICLGDLARYLADTGDAQNSFLSERYYRQAFCIDPTVGMPYNQLGTLAGMSSYGCEASYYYMRCLLSPQPFEGAEGNLQKVFEKNNETFKEIDMTDDEAPRSLFVRRFMARFLKVSEQLFEQQDENIHALCQDTLRDLDICLNPSCKEDILENAKMLNKPVSLDPQLVYKLVMMSLMCIARLQMKSSPLISTAAAFTLTLFSHIIRHYVKDLKMKLYPQLPIVDNDQLDNAEDRPGTRSTSGTVTPTPTQVYVEQSDNVNSSMNCVGKSSRRSQEKNKKQNRRSASHLRLLRRRRNASSTSQEDSEMSEEDIADSDMEDKRLSDPGAANSDISETGSCSSGSLTEQEDDLGEISAKQMCARPSNQLKMSNCTSEAINIASCNGVLSNDDESGLEDSVNCSLNNSKNLGLNYEDPKKLSSVNNNLKNNRLECEEIKASVKDICEMLSSNSFLPTIKIISDWMRTNPDIITACAENSRPLWCRITDLLNVLLKVEAVLLDGAEQLQLKLKTLQRGKTSCQLEPLAEDIEMQEFSLLAQAHNNLNFNAKRKVKLSYTEQAFLRMQCILYFGDVLTKFSKTNISWSMKTKTFAMGCPGTPRLNGTGSPENQEMNAGDMEIQRKQLMRNMAQLWLKAEVSDLEVLVENNGGTPHLSPYLVPDTGALCHHLPLLKQLESARRFIIIVPSIVISNLDHLKRDSVGAREAIRWIENELRRGSRFLRAQKQQERLSVQPIKYPRKKDKDAWDFFQVLECSNYLNQQRSKNDSAAPLVTLITGGNQILPTNAIAIAQSAGIHMQPIEEFISKWRSSSKSQG